MPFEFATIGLNHGHIYGQTEAMLAAGCTLTRFAAEEDELAARYAEAFPQATRCTVDEIMADESIRLIVAAPIPAARAALAIRAMEAGKDVMVDKPGCLTLDELTAIKATREATGRIWSVLYSEHYRQKATTRALELVRDGAIGKVIHMTGFGPHRIGDYGKRYPWFWDPAQNGTILTDIAAHQFEQFLAFTGAVSARVLQASEANHAHPQYPGFTDYGHAVVEADTGALGFLRVDWFTPAGSPVWGDGRTFLTGTKGTIELRKYMDIEGRAGGDHLFLTDAQGTRHVDCTDTPLPYGPALRDDVLNRSETAMPQPHCFHATELALKAAALARDSA
ncbi:Gfo/Idh/MocA family protein [Vannielia litorea]|uniref:Gfo/Idh/MocA family protein n=1 Tax=Vannielia litorea TaxID=1217970 RepID=UPI001BCDF63C|nr:Gfo/Idh/MocA family oxidoreductase [Vannielia litorea]MBS8226781.1 gfo/Idh/MocA family oxidoreductase [Vannielia litorea]